MGLRSRLKSTVKSVLGLSEAEPPARPTPPAPAPPTPASPAPAPPVSRPAPPPPAPDPIPLPEPTPEPEPEPVVLAPEPEPVVLAPEPPRNPVLYASDVETSDAPVRNAHHRPKFEANGQGFQVRVYNEAENLDVSFECQPGEYVLEGAERAGFELPYSCRSGGCLTCSGKTVSGQVEMGEQYVLEDEHQARGFVLLCLTAVTSDAVFESHQQDNIQ